MSDLSERSLRLHEEKQGKISVESTVRLSTRDDLSLSYTPGVAAVSRAIAKDPSTVWRYTARGRSVAVLTDGSAVLGLGSIGPEAALPVMEGKAVLFKTFAAIDAYPICVDRRKASVVDVARAIAPGFGGINLEDIKAPECFAIEAELQDLGIPVMHDDQHGTAVVLLAALLNASRIVGKDVEDLRIVINGAGAAGFAIMRLLRCIDIDPTICRTVRSIIVCDSNGIIGKARDDLTAHKKIIAEQTNAEGRAGDLAAAMKGADVFIGVSVGDVVSKAMVRSMNNAPIIFAMANPTPEIDPDEAKEAGARIVATGRSDYDNQINNVLAFPGIFRGALDAKAVRITDKMKIMAAHAIAASVEKPTEDLLIPSPLDEKVASAVAEAVKKAALDEGVTRD